MKATTAVAAKAAVATIIGLLGQRKECGVFGLRVFFLFRGSMLGW